jgi:arylsulfatase A
MDYWQYAIDHNGSSEKADGKTYLTDDLTERAIRYIRNHQSQPFFLHLAYYAPHRPLQATDEKLAKYKDRDDLTAGQKLVYAMIESMDDGIARIINLLHETGLEKNTIVIFTSDNGPDNHEADGISPARENLGLRGCKYSVHDGGIRVPAMVRWPDGMLSDRDNHDLFHFVDFLPTLAAACKVVIPQNIGLDGENRLPVWQDNADNVNPIRFWQWNRHYPYPNCNAAMRDGDWKLVYPKLNGYNKMSQANIDMILGKRPYETTRPQMLELGQPDKPLLFNIKDDPFETQDLSLANIQRVGQMTAALNDWYGDVMTDFTAALDVQFAN